MMTENEINALCFIVGVLILLACVWNSVYMHTHYNYVPEYSTPDGTVYRLEPIDE